MSISFEIRAVHYITFNNVMMFKSMNVSYFGKHIANVFSQTDLFLHILKS